MIDANYSQFSAIIRQNKPELWCIEQYNNEFVPQDENLAFDPSSRFFLHQLALSLSERAVSS
jgi:hypothetical protein